MFIEILIRYAQVLHKRDYKKKEKTSMQNLVHYNKEFFHFNLIFLFYFFVFIASLKIIINSFEISK